jgi:hypothetical protein
MPLALRWGPPAVGREQSPSIRGELIARAERHGRSGDVPNPIEPHRSALWRPLTHPAGHDEPPYGDTGHPNPRIPRGRSVEPSQRALLLLGMHKAPACVQLAGHDLEGTPQGKPHQAAVWGRSLQPCPHGIFVDSDDTGRRADRIACCSCAHRHLKNGWGGMQIHVRCPISNRHRRFASLAPRLFLAVTPAMLDEGSLQARTPRIPATPVRTGERLPVHGALHEKVTIRHRACDNEQESAKFITAVEGHYQNLRQSPSTCARGSSGWYAGRSAFLRQRVCTTW